MMIEKKIFSSAEEADAAVSSVEGAKLLLAQLEYDEAIRSRRSASAAEEPAELGARKDQEKALRDRTLEETSLSGAAGAGPQLNSLAALSRSLREAL
eukprot:115301-Hanusia_phi.AAC.2